MEGIEGSRLRRSQGLSFQSCFLSANPNGIGIVLDDALQIQPVPGQDAGYILKWNGVTGWKCFDSRRRILRQHILRTYR